MINNPINASKTNVKEIFDESSPEGAYIKSTYKRIVGHDDEGNEYYSFYQNDKGEVVVLRLAVSEEESVYKHH